MQETFNDHHVKDGRIRHNQQRQHTAPDFHCCSCNNKPIFRDRDELRSHAQEVHAAVTIQEFTECTCIVCTPIYKHPSTTAESNSTTTVSDTIELSARLDEPPDQVMAEVDGADQLPTSLCAMGHQLAENAWGEYESAKPGTTSVVGNLSENEVYDIVLQPETRPISQEQLVAEVKGIYAGLVMVEAKCIEVDNTQAVLASTDPSTKMDIRQWQALIALHRTLLHEHHDFFLASQHPLASPALRQLATKYSMPARMWRHGIHSFLELLRHRLPASLDHMLAFVYLAYSMLGLLYETVPIFKHTWIECLGDLARYRMAIEVDDIGDQAAWATVARDWYLTASDLSPETGRFYHHLGILAQPNALQQVFYYLKSLCALKEFKLAQQSILTFFDPVLKDLDVGYRFPSLDTAFVKAHGLLFTRKDLETEFRPACKEFLQLLDPQIGRITRKFMEQGYYIAVANISALSLSLRERNEREEPQNTQENLHTDNGSTVSELPFAEQLFHDTFKVVLDRIGDPNVLPFVHVVMVFLNSTSLIRPVPWDNLTILLNTLLVQFDASMLQVLQDSENFPPYKKDDFRPFPEDFALRGLPWTANFFPAEWFTSEKNGKEERYHEKASMTAQRKERILWLAIRIARTSSGSGLSFDSGKLNNTKPEFMFRMDPPISVHDELGIVTENTQASSDGNRYQSDGEDEDDIVPSHV